jgi:hypothetical protein
LEGLKSGFIFSKLMALASEKALSIAFVFKDLMALGDIAWIGQYVT